MTTANTELVELMARVLEPQAWAALATGDTLAYKNRRTSSLRKAASCYEVVRPMLEERERLLASLAVARQQSKRRGRDLLREEADAVLPHFRKDWEPLRRIAGRTGAYSASQLASRARNLEKRGLVEKRWNSGVMTICEWRAALNAGVEEG